MTEGKDVVRESERVEAMFGKLGSLVADLEFSQFALTQRDKELEEARAREAEYQAHVERLRGVLADTNEALEEAATAMGVEYGYSIRAAENALASTPAQSAQSVRDEVLREVYGALEFIEAHSIEQEEIVQRCLAEINAMKSGDA